MPNTPYGVADDQIEVFRSSGSDLILKLGRLLWERHRARRRLDFEESREADEIAADITKTEEDIRRFFADNPKARMKTFTHDKRNIYKINPRVCRVIACLAASHLLDDRESISIMSVAAAISDGEDPAELLESRRVVAGCGVEGWVEISSDPGYMPKVRLGSQVMATVLGSRECIAHVCEQSLVEAREQRRKQCSVGERRSKGRATKHVHGGSDIVSFVKSVPMLTPREIVNQVRELGYIGQEDAVKSVALAASRHVARLRKVHLTGIRSEEMAARQNILLMGGTGCGKSFLSDLIFCQVLSLPVVSIDATQFSEVGYVGQDPSTILTRLYLAADKNISVSSTGVIILDELDKIADAGGAERSLVSREGVQRGILKLLEPNGSVDVPAELDRSWRSPRISMRTDTILFLGLGAFSKWDEVVGSNKEPVGFHDDASRRHAETSAAEFQRYGLMPELMGRFGVHVLLDALSRDEMMAILKRVIDVQYRRDLEADGINLAVEAEAMDLLIEISMSRGTGARSLSATLERTMTDALFESYSMAGTKSLRVYVEGDRIRWHVKKRRRRRRSPEKDIEDAELMEGLEEELIQ